MFLRPDIFKKAQQLLKEECWNLIALILDYNEKIYTREQVVPAITDVVLKNLVSPNQQELDLCKRLDTLYYERIFERIRGKDWFKKHPFRRFFTSVDNII